MGSSTENSIYGASKNPVNTEYVTGGSSGGSAAVVAADMCNVSLGSDTGGSIRQPASYCGVVGLKPTYSRVSRYGLVAYASSFDCIGPFSKNVTDAAIMLKHISGHDPMDNSSSDKPVDDYLADLNSNSNTLKVGVPEEYFGEGLDGEVRKIIEDQLKALENDGVELVPVKLPHMKYGIATYYILATAEASSNLARFDGIRYGHRADHKKVEEELSAERAEIKKVLKGKSAAEIEVEMSRVDSQLIRLYKKIENGRFWYRS